MNFLLTVCAGFLTYYHQIQHCGAYEFDLDAFIKNFEKSQSELQWIRDQSHKVEDKRSSSVDSRESNYDDDDESSVDLWYNKYRKSECEMNHANPDSKILNGYCGVNDDDNERSSRFDGIVGTNSFEHLAAPDYKIEPQDTKNEKVDIKDNDSDAHFDSFDKFQEEGDHDHFDLESDSKLSLEDKLNIEEYNDQMVPNPNFYKINNEMSYKNEQLNKDHDSFRNDLGFSSALNKYPSKGTDIYHELENENQNNFQRRTIQRKRNARGFDKNDMYIPQRFISPSSYDHLSDQEDTHKNDLSHEADYKLSKNEQDPQNKPQNGQYFQNTQELPNEQEFQDPHEYQNEHVPHNEFINKFHKQPKNRPHNRYEPQNSVREKIQNQQVGGIDLNDNQFEDVYRYNKKFIDPSKKANLMKTGSKSNVFPKKQSLKSGSNPSSKHDKSSQLTDEINLKISNRMMSRGLGPSLPSQSMKNYQNQYRHPMNIDVENQHWKNTGDELSNDLTDYIGTQRRLLQFDYDESSNDYPLRENSNTPNEKNILKIGLVKTVNDEKRSNDGEMPKKVTNNSEKQKLKNSGKQLQLSEKTNVAHFDPNSISQSTKENKKLLNLEKCVTNCEKSYTEGNSDRKSPENSTIEIQDEHKIEPKSEPKNNNTLSGHINSLKLQLELNISNETLNEASSTSKLNSNKANNEHAKIVKRSAAYEKQLGIQETKIQEISRNSSIVDLVSGKLPNQLIQAVFQIVKENGRLNKLIGSKLDLKIVDNLDENSINLFKTKQKTERMVKKLMSSITDLIEEQITHQTCILLPPDLQSFYDKVIYVRSINARVNNMRKEHKDNADSDKNSSKRVVRSTVPESDLHQKYKTVGKLLKQFGHLKLRDQVKIFDIKQYLQNHLQLLDDLKTLNSEFVRRSRSVESKNIGSDNREKKSLEVEKGGRLISREYANLLKTTKLIKATSLTDMDRIDVVSSY